METSGSWNSKAKLCVPGGTFVHWSLGETALGPAFEVNLSLMIPPSSMSGEVSVSGRLQDRSRSSATTSFAALVLRQSNANAESEKQCSC